ncbi:polymeric immunoglobulin receptor-like [Hemiscyllium ocellatum]|uniref:polymeric immunoglobulin receptor-like n=1 Tax=Hemiscyllium ocellatum TaxID=170820 RepID=UPI002965DBC5|nr:polymeric immunoglobulin receptor-like [Hemiscyllium ocellatum]
MVDEGIVPTFKRDLDCHNVYTKTLGEHHGLYKNDFEHSKFPINEVALGGGASKQETQFEKNGAERLTSRTELIFVNKTMWTLILLICSIPVSGALWAEKNVTGILGRAITISCQYEVRMYQSHIKYWCRGWSRQCNVIATTHWPNGRISITDNKTQGIFLVAMKNLQPGDAGWYSCGIEMFGYDPMFNVKLHIYNEAVSVPGLQYLSQTNVSCSGGSVTVSCESARGSLPIHYTWSEKTPSQDSMISDSNKLDLHCQSFTQQHHQYYCTASNTQGTKSSEIVHVSVNNVREKNCSYRIQINSIGSEYTCDKSSTISSSTSTTISSTTSPTETGIPSGPKSVSKSYVAWDVIRWVLFTLLVICSVSVTMFTRKHSLSTPGQQQPIHILNLLASGSYPADITDVLMAAKHVSGILGRAITISCYYENWWYQSNVKYWCHGRNRSCNIIAKTDWPNGRISITDNKTQGIFLVTMKNLQWEDAGWYSCGIQIPGIYSDLMFNVNLHISEEAVSVPGLRFLSQPNVSCSGGPVTVSCESAQGSLPIHYTWSEKTPSQDSKISYTNKLDLHCQSFTQQHHQYYCTASNTQGTKPSEIVHVSVNNVREKNCSYRIQINSIGEQYTCAVSSTTSPGTTHSPNTSGGFSTSQNQSPGKNSHEKYYILCFDSVCEINNIF